MHLSVRVNFVYECSFLLDLHFNFARGRLPFDGRPTERKPVPSLTRIMHKRRRPKLMAEMSHARARAHPSRAVSPRDRIEFRAFMIF